MSDRGLIGQRETQEWKTLQLLNNYWLVMCPVMDSFAALLSRLYDLVRDSKLVKLIMSSIP